MEESISDHLAACSPFADCIHWSNSYYNRLQWSLWIWTTSGGGHKYDIAQLVLVHLGEFYRLLREWLWERRTKPQYWDWPFFARNKGVNIEPDFSCCALRQYHKVRNAFTITAVFCLRVQYSTANEYDFCAAWSNEMVANWKAARKNRKFINKRIVSDPLGNKGHPLKDFTRPA